MSTDLDLLPADQALAHHIDPIGELNRADRDLRALPQLEILTGRTD